MARESLVNEFIRRLQEAERTRDGHSLTELFEKNAQLANLTRHHTVSGADHHRQEALCFWSQYLSVFAEISSYFEHVYDDGRCAVLEWHATGAMMNGLPVDYRGVSIIEYGDDKIREFRTYYDSAALLPNLPRTGKAFSESVGAPDITDQITS